MQSYRRLIGFSLKTPAKQEREREKMLHPPDVHIDPKSFQPCPRISFGKGSKILGKTLILVDSSLADPVTTYIIATTYNGFC